jgi:hypothetical protein
MKKNYYVGAEDILNFNCFWIGSLYQNAFLQNYCSKEIFLLFKNAISALPYKFR